jgi:myo-inositol catabolism protein IolC
MGCVTGHERWRPTHDDPLFILAMDHRDSFGATLFGVHDGAPTPGQLDHMERAKSLIYQGLTQALPDLPAGRAGVLVDEQYGEAVIDAAAHAPMVLAVPIEASGHEWFTLQWPGDWLDHVRRVGPDYAKVLVRDNPALPQGDRQAQLALLAAVSTGLDGAAVPLIFELLVPATPEQLASVGGDADRYDREVRPPLVAQVIADSQAAGVEPALWKVEGLETVDAAQLIADAARAEGRRTDLIVLGRDAPVERLDHWLEIAARIDAFVGFAIGRSIWEGPIRDWAAATIDDAAAAGRIAASYLSFAGRWHPHGSQ